jgi:hypothetical protein
MNDTMTIGTETATWAVKDFSVELRRQITKAAQRQNCTVAEWLHGHFQRFGVDGHEFTPVKITEVERPPTPSASSVEDLCRIAEATAKLAETRERMPRAMRGLSAALTRQMREALPQGEARKAPRQKLLEAPRGD